MPKMWVRCSYEIEVDVPYDPVEQFEYAQFDIEENHCPGTGSVGASFDKNYENSNKKGVCWACNLNGENRIIGLRHDAHVIAHHDYRVAQLERQHLEAIEALQGCADKSEVEHLLTDHADQLPEYFRTVCAKAEKALSLLTSTTGIGHLPSD